MLPKAVMKAFAPALSADRDYQALWLYPGVDNYPFPGLDNAWPAGWQKCSELDSGTFHNTKFILFSIANKQYFFLIL